MVSDIDSIILFVIEISLWLVPLIFAVSAHEAGHAYVARFCGDFTASKMGRITLNPIPHIDRFGTIFIPIICLLSPAGFIFGYAKPVPINVTALKSPRRDMALVAGAGPLVNIIIALISAILMHLTLVSPEWFWSWWIAMLERSILLNIILAVFNCIPLLPLDGGRIVVSLMPFPLAKRLVALEKYGIVIIVFVLFLLPLIGVWVGLDLGHVQRFFSNTIFGLSSFVLNVFGIR
jgi:Zn-dependent protease